MRTLLTTLHSKYIHPSLALPSLAAFCGEECGELLIREFTVHEPKENILALLLQEQPEVVAFSVYLWNRRETFELIDLLHAVRPEIKLVVGGPEVSFDDAGLFARHPGLTALVRGEGELPLRKLLHGWQRQAEEQPVPRVLRRIAEGLCEGPAGPELEDLDLIPSPFAAGLVDTSRGFVYLETSRGCPYRCAFCMSALDERVRSFSMERIKSDLRWLLERQVPKIKLVDRTFNYDPRRAREIFRFILQHNRGSHLHFEIGAHLLDQESLELLARVPAGVFQFEIGIQSTLDETLAAIERKVDRQQLESNITWLQQQTAIDLHLDLIAGLPGETLNDFLASVDKVMAGNPDHLQIELVKLLPGSPLRQQAAELNIRFDPHPPYTVLETSELSYPELQLLKQLSRLLDQSWNHGRLRGLLLELARLEGGFATGLVELTRWWQEQGLFRHPLSQEGLYLSCWEFLRHRFDGMEREELRLALARDYARENRVIPERAPAFFDIVLTPAEQQRVQQRVAAELDRVRGQGVKLQYFAANFAVADGLHQRQLRLYLYRSASGRSLETEEIDLSSDSPTA